MSFNLPFGWQVDGTAPGTTVISAERTLMLSASCVLTPFARLTRRGRCCCTHSQATSAVRNMKIPIFTSRQRHPMITHLSLNRPQLPNHASTDEEQGPKPLAEQGSKPAAKHQLPKRGVVKRLQTCSGILNCGSCYSSH